MRLLLLPHGLRRQLPAPEEGRELHPREQAPPLYLWTLSPRPIHPRLSQRRDCAESMLSGTDAISQGEGDLPRYRCMDCRTDRERRQSGEVQAGAHPLLRSGGERLLISTIPR